MRLQYLRLCTLVCVEPVNDVHQMKWRLIAVWPDLQTVVYEAIDENDEQKVVLGL